MDNMKPKCKYIKPCGWDAACCIKLYGFPHTACCENTTGFVLYEYLVVSSAEYSPYSYASLLHWAEYLGQLISCLIPIIKVMITTNMSAAVGGITWAILDYRHENKWSALGFCCGLISGLVVITPASGYVTPSSSILFGFVGALVCNFSMSFKHLLKVDDVFDVFVIHGVGGIAGNLLTGIFADKSVAAVDGQVIAGGWIDGNWKQIGIQALDTVAGFVYSFVMTMIILFVINKIPGLSLRVDNETEQTGLDTAEVGFSMYEHVKEALGTVCLVPNGGSALTLINENAKIVEETTFNENWPVYNVRL